MLIIIRHPLLYLAVVFSACSSVHYLAPPESVIPLPRDREYSWMSVAEWKRQHAEDVAIAQDGGVDLLFMGDSITAGWPQSIWQENFQSFSPANFAIGGDQTQNVLWRLRNGTIGKLNPRAVVLLIGVNNFGHGNHTPKQVYQGIDTIVAEVHEAFPAARILLLGILPFGEHASDPNRQKVSETNRLLQKLNARDYIGFYDFGHIFLREDGSISTDIMADFLHPTPKGYELFAAEITPIVEKWLTKK